MAPGELNINMNISVFIYSTLLIIILLSNTAYSQDSKNYLTYKRGNVYDLRMNKLDFKQITYFMNEYPDALSQMRLARTYQIIGISISSLGAVSYILSLTGLEAMESTNDYHLNYVWTLLGVGCALVGTGFIFSSGYKKHTKTAIDLYNNSISKHTSMQTYAVKVGFMSSGMGISVQF